MTTLLVIDIGNTNVSLGVFDYPEDSDVGELRGAVDERNCKIQARSDGLCLRRRGEDE